MAGGDQTQEEEAVKPNPGSNAALDAGCICPVFDNNRGKYPPWPPDGWWIRGDCPIHGPTDHALTLGSMEEPE